MVTTIGLTGAVRDTSPARSGLNRTDWAAVTLMSATCGPAFIAGPVLGMFRTVAFRCRGLSDAFVLGSSIGDSPMLAGTALVATVALFSLVDATEGVCFLFL